jgi:hypothetical protein
MVAFINTYQATVPTETAIFQGALCLQPPSSCFGGLPGGRGVRAGAPQRALDSPSWEYGLYGFFC